MFKYFLIYEENCETNLSEEEFYKRFTYMSYRYINMRREGGSGMYHFILKTMGFQSLFSTYLQKYPLFHQGTGRK